MKKLLMTIILVATTIFLFTSCSKKDDLSACDEKRKEIEEKYGIILCITENEIDFDEFTKVKVIEDEEELKKALENLDEVLATIPSGFIEELKSYSQRTLNIVISESYSSGVKFVGNNQEFWTIDRRNINMDISKNIIYSVYKNMNRPNCDMDFLDDWEDYNPEGFSYGNIEEYSQYLFDGNNTYDTYFITKTMMENKYDDIENCFWCLWKDEMIMYNAMAAPKIHAKFEYLCSELDRVFETVDENAYWARYIK